MYLLALCRIVHTVGINGVELRIVRPLLHPPSPPPENGKLDIHYSPNCASSAKSCCSPILYPYIIPFTPFPEPPHVIIHLSSNLASTQHHPPAYRNVGKCDFLAVRPPLPFPPKMIQVGKIKVIAVSSLVRFPPVSFPDRALAVLHPILRLPVVRAFFLLPPAAQQ